MLRKFQVEHKILPENRDSVFFFRKLKRNVATPLMIWLKSRLRQDVTQIQYQMAYSNL